MDFIFYEKIHTHSMKEQRFVRFVGDISLVFGFIKAHSCSMSNFYANTMFSIKHIFAKFILFTNSKKKNEKISSTKHFHNFATLKGTIDE